MDYLERLRAHNKSQRTMLMNQLQLLECGKMRTGTDVFGNMVEDDAKRIRVWIRQREACIANIESALVVRDGQR